MTREQFLKRFSEILVEVEDGTRRKNQDYANADDAFFNFRGVQNLTGGRIPLEHGILSRLAEKLTRVSNLTFSEAVVREETMSDTLTDIAVYALIWRIYREQMALHISNSDGSTIIIKG